MRIGVLGINHKSSELSFRERLAKACHKKLSAETEIAERLCCVLLSTCNRTEIFFSAEDLAAAHSELLGVLREEIAEPFEHKLYTYFGCDCFAHLALVTAGLDSVILAETEIQRQVKIAYENTAIYYRLPSGLHYLFQKCLKIGKEIRSNLTLPLGQVSLPEMILQISKWVFENSLEKKVLFLGNSEINRKVLSFLKNKGFHRISLCTRSLASARGLQETHGVVLTDWSQLSSWIDYDLIICGTNVPDYLITPRDLDNSDPIATSKLILDLSVPRNVDPSLARHPRITLLNMEEVGSLIERKQNRASIEVQRAEQLVLAKVQQYAELFRQKTECGQKVFLCV